MVELCFTNLNAQDPLFTNLDPTLFFFVCLFVCLFVFGQKLICILFSLISLLIIFIFDLLQITKDKYWQKPTYDSLQSTLEAMANHCKEHKVTHISMPRIGCGLDGLKWPTVSDVIKKVFEDTNMTVTVYTL